MFGNFFPENRAFCEAMWKKCDRARRATDDNVLVIWRVRLVCWMTNVTDTHSEHVIIIAFLLRRWLHQRASLLRYTSTYIACLLVDSNTLQTQCTMLDRILTVT
jgi:hypothetical protein